MFIKKKKFNFFLYFTFIFLSKNVDKTDQMRQKGDFNFLSEYYFLVDSHHQYFWSYSQIFHDTLFCYIKDYVVWTCKQWIYPKKRKNIACI